MIDLSPPPLILPQHFVATRPALIRADVDGDRHFPRLELIRERAMLPGMVPIAARGARYPTIVSTNNGGANGSGVLTTWAAPLPASIAAGNLLLIHGAAAQGTGARTVSTPAGWASLFNDVGQTNLRRIWCFYKVAAGSEGASVNISANDTAFWSGVSYQIAGFQGVPIAAAALANATTANPDPPALTITWGSASGSLVLAICSDDVSPTTAVVAPSGYSNLISGRNVNGAAIWTRSSSAMRLVLGTSEDPGTFTIPASGPASAHTLAIRGG